MVIDVPLLMQKVMLKSTLRFPSISKEKIATEIPLVRYLAYEVIRNCSEV